MNAMKNTTPLLASLLVGLLTAGCVSMPNLDSIVDDRKVEYKKTADSQSTLEVPPDLTSSRIDESLVVPETGTTYSEYAGAQKNGLKRPGAQAAVLTEVDSVELKREGDKRWLVIKAPPDQVWASLISFWQQQGILLQEQDPGAGVMKTSWLENRADIKSDFITDTVRKVFDGLYSSNTRDQFRVRLERGTNGATELYLTHTGMQEEIASGSAGQSQQQVWKPRPTDHGLEAVMLRRIMMHLGVSEQRATAEAKKGGGAAKTGSAPRSQMMRNQGQVALQINENQDTAWRLVGMALDQVGFAVEDRNQAEGVYSVRYADPYADSGESKGMLSKLAFWKGDSKPDPTAQYQVRLSGQGGSTQVTVHSNKGGSAETQARILTLLHEQIR